MKMDTKNLKNFENSPVAFLYGSASFNDTGEIVDFKVLYVNRYFKNMTGFQNEGILNKSFTEVFGVSTPIHKDWLSRILRIAMASSYCEEEVYSHLLKSWYKIRFERESNDSSDFKCWVMDITKERKQREQLNLLETIVSTVSDPMSVVDLNYRYLAVNKGYTKIHSKPENEIVGRKISDFYTHNNHFNVHIKPKLDECFKGNSIRYKQWIEPPNKKKSYFEICYYPRYSGSGNVIGCVIHGKDLTEEIILRKKLSNVIDGTDAGTWERNLLTGEIFINERWANMIGYTLDELQPIDNNTWRTRIHPADLKRVNNALADHYKRKKEYYECDYRLKHKNGNWIWVLARGKVLEWDKEGKPAKMFGTHIDITRRKTAEEEMVRSWNLLQSIIDTLPGTLNVIDKEYRIIAYNQNNRLLEKIRSADKDTIFGKKCYELYMNRATPCPMCKLEEALKTRRSFTEIIAENDPREDMSGKAAKVFTSPICDTEGNVCGAVEYSLDITDLKRAKDTAEALKKQKEEFFTNMSHDLRTPVNSIVGYSEMLKKKVSENIKNEYLNNIINTSGNLLRIIQNILEFSKADSGKLRLMKERTDFYQILEDSFELIKPLLNDKTRFNLSRDIRTPRFINTDGRKLEHILTNLLSNAVKFTESGVITLSVELLNVQDDEATIRISVKDTGIGIAKEAQRSITNMFNQADHSIHKKYGGSGLGLSVVSKFLKLFNSRLVIKSTFGKGSEFSFVFHAEILDNSEKDYDILKDAYFKVLIVEDNDINIILLEAMIKKDFKNAAISIAKNGQRAVEICDEEKPDIIFMDINIPIINGFVATKKIRNLPLSSDVSIIGFTASAVHEIYKRAKESGMDKCITKPVTSEKIKKIITSSL